MKVRTAFFLGILFFALALITLPDYGINWDTINHLPRGQAYLQYLLSGKKDYSSEQLIFQDWFKKNEWFYQDPSTLSVHTNLPQGEFATRSYYQNDSLDYNYFMKYDGGGHPPLSDILSASFNRVLYSKLQVVNDIDSYRVYGVLLAALTVALIYYWTSLEFGASSGFIAALSLATYPLFWSESHFNNEKDIPEAFYWSLFMFGFWKAVTTRKLRWFLCAAVAAGFALGTKFNILFSVFVIVPWFVIYLLHRKKSLPYILSYAKSIKVWIGIVLIPLFMMGIFVGSWPYLWPDPLSRIGSVIGFYKQLGTTNTPMTGFMSIFGINTFPMQWILFTTPPVLLCLGAVGIFKAFISQKRGDNKFSLLVLLWFLVPILRVIWPNSNTYGGVRQLMEYIPAFAILCGIGFSWLIELSNRYFKKFGILLVSITVIVGFLINIRTLYNIHPNENVYFNSLIGGLSGAKERNFPYWGFSFGAPYRQAIAWINEHAEPNATLVFAYELIPNFPRIWLRPDIFLVNAERSGYLAAGEYAITLNYQGTDTRSYYDSYLTKFVTPVYTAKVDGVPVVSVWKNNPEHFNQRLNEQMVPSVKFTKTETDIIISWDEPLPLWRLEVDYKDQNCSKLSSGWIYVSKDHTTYERMPGELPDEWRVSKLGEQPKNGHFIEPFVGQIAKSIKLTLKPANTCLRNITNIKVFSL